MLGPRRVAGCTRGGEVARSGCLRGSGPFYVPLLLCSADVHMLLVIVGKIKKFTPKQANKPKLRY